MSMRILIAGAMALGLGAAGAVHAQTTTGTAPSTSPPERMNGSSTMNNPATALTPPPGSPAGQAAPGTTGSTAPALGSPGNATPGATRPNTHGSAAPVSGANSFTEGQARSRLRDRGFTKVSGLKLDHQGIWRAKATKDGKPVTVALDYRGNVVAHSATAQAQ